MCVREGLGLLNVAPIPRVTPHCAALGLKLGGWLADLWGSPRSAFCQRPRSPILVALIKEGIVILSSKGLAGWCSPEMGKALA